MKQPKSPLYWREGGGWSQRSGHRVHRVAMTTFWRTFHHDGKIRPDWVHRHAPSIRSHKGTKVVWPDFQPMRVPEEPVCILLFPKNPVFTFLHLKSLVHVAPPLVRAGCARPSTFTVSTSRYKVVVYAPAENTPPISTLPLYILCGSGIRHSVSAGT